MIKMNSVLTYLDRILDDSKCFVFDEVILGNLNISRHQSICCLQIFCGLVVLDVTLFSIQIKQFFLCANKNFTGL